MYELSITIIFFIIFLILWYLLWRKDSQKETSRILSEEIDHKFQKIYNFIESEELDLINTIKQLEKK